MRFENAISCTHASCVSSHSWIISRLSLTPQLFIVAIVTNYQWSKLILTVTENNIPNHIPEARNEGWAPWARTKIKQVAKYVTSSSILLPIAVHVGSSAGLPAAYSDKWEIPSADFPSPYRSKQGVHGPRRAHSTAVTSLRETRYQHEKITGEFFQGAPARNPYVRMLLVRMRAPAMLFTCKFLHTRARVYTSACVIYVRGCMHAVTFETLREEIADTNLRCIAVRRRREGNAAKGTEVIRFLLLLRLISAFSSDLDRKADGKLGERMPGKRANRELSKYKHESS